MRTISNEISNNNLIFTKVDKGDSLVTRHNIEMFSYYDLTKKSISEKLGTLN